MSSPGKRCRSDSQSSPDTQINVSWINYIQRTFDMIWNAEHVSRHEIEPGLARWLSGDGVGVPHEISEEPAQDDEIAGESLCPKWLA